MGVSKTLMVASIVLATATFTLPSEATVNAWTHTPGALCESANPSTPSSSTETYAHTGYNANRIYCIAMSLNGQVNGSNADRALVRTYDSQNTREISAKCCWQAASTTEYCGGADYSGNNYVGAWNPYLEKPSTGGGTTYSLFLDVTFNVNDYVYNYVFEDCTSEYPYCP